ncbi:MAG: TetR/AcrR family transcriptional regulator C-terminal domain-containing protein [Candidatus Nanopelagicales bacterium]|jgi:AcrR family transcriptional regulator|nr:TetR/AcrR family transcriptional regulator C-terminal domain-containing protein [Candidatus Nanopelagicales bacterium]
MPQRERLTRERVVRAAVDMADRDGVDDVSMRRLAADLDVVPMALYKHVANKAELLDGMVDQVINEIAPPQEHLPWKQAVRTRILDARQVLLRHPWARRVMESKAAPTPTALGYMDSMIAIFVAGGLSLDLTHHVMHALGSRIFGFSQELFTESAGVQPDPAMAAQLAQAFPNVVAVAQGVEHDPDSVIGPGCDDQFEFEFALDLQLDAVERLHENGWRSSVARAAGTAP